MPGLIPHLLSSPAAHAIAALSLALLLLHFHSRYNRRYLMLWSASWASLAIFHASNGIHLAIASQAQPDAPAALVSSIVSVASGYLQLVWLLWGCFDLAGWTPFGRRERRTLGVALFALSGVSWFSITSLSAAGALEFGLVGIHSLVGGVTLILCAWGIWTRRAKEGTIGFTVIRVAFGAYGLIQLFYFFTSAAAIFEGRPVDSYFGLSHIALQAAVGVGMFICLLDDERSAAVLAASQVEHLAYHDTLTGLPNRGLFMTRLTTSLSQAMRHRYKVAVLFLDLDRFKEINDSLGHSAGDTLLRSAAQRIRASVRDTDTVARFGGDEFTILIPIIGRVEDAGRIAGNIIEALREPIRIGERDIVVTTSVGIAIYPLDGEDAETLVRNADTAMYGAKQHGRDAYRLYAAAMNSRSLERLELENRLRQALRNNELVLYYQPLMDLRDGGVFGLEALLRWNHPEQGLLLPDKFIATAEVSGLIVPIGKWVMREACRQARSWLDRGLDLVVSVNLSPRQFCQPDLLFQVQSALAEARLPAANLELEITEGSAMHDVEQTIRVLRELKRLGVRISIDDFGTGHSSLSYLKKFPVDTVKLDQSFVRDITEPQDGAIASGIISMAHNLSLLVLAEGVETEGQLNFLRKNNCDRLQGFLFSVPLSPTAFEKFVHRNQQYFRAAARA